MDFGDIEAELVSPATAFEVLGHPVRIDCIRALYEAGGPDGPGRLDFSELQDRVGVRDSGRFTYHLDRLRGLFVRKTDSGYGLTYAGVSIYRSVATGLYRGQITHEPEPLDDPCPNCGTSLALRYDNDNVHVGCPDCAFHVLDLPIPVRAVVGHDPAEFERAITIRAHQHLRPISRQICPWCGGALDGTLAPIDALPVDPGPTYEVYSRQQCTACGGMHFAPAGLFVLYLPAVVDAYREAGHALHEEPIWTLDIYTTDDHASVERRGEETVSVEIEPPVPDGPRVRIDDSLSVAMPDE